MKIEKAGCLLPIKIITCHLIKKMIIEDTGEHKWKIKIFSGTVYDHSRGEFENDKFIMIFRSEELMNDKGGKNQKKTNKTPQFINSTNILSVQVGKVRNMLLPKKLLPLFRLI